MKKYARFISVAMAAMMFTSICTAPALANPCPEADTNYDAFGYAAGLVEEKEDLGLAFPNGISIEYNGTQLKLGGVAPELKDGNTMISLNQFCEEIGAKYQWDSATNTATATLAEGKSIAFTIGSMQAQDLAHGKIDMITAPYAHSNNLFVPVRDLAGAANYSLYWDEYYDLVSIVDNDAIAAQIDSGFTIINGLIANAAKQQLDANKTYAYNVEGKLDAVLYGDVQHSTAGVKGKMSGLIGKTGQTLDGTMNLDLDGVSSSQEVKEKFGLDDPETFEKMNQLLKNISANTIINMDNGEIFAKSNVLSIFDEMISKDTWIKFAGLQLDADAIRAEIKPMTIGRIVASQLGPYYSDARFVMLEAEVKAAQYELLFGDANIKTQKNGDITTYSLAQSKSSLTKATASGIGSDLFDSYNSILPALQLWASLERTNFAWSVKEQNGAIIDSTIDVDLKVNGTNPYELIIKSSGNAKNAKVNFNLKGKFVGKIIAEISSSVTETTQKIPSAPPEGDKVIDLADLVVPEEPME